MEEMSKERAEEIASKMEDIFLDALEKCKKNEIKTVIALGSLLNMTLDAIYQTAPNFEQAHFLVLSCLKSAFDQYMRNKEESE